MVDTTTYAGDESSSSQPSDSTRKALDRISVRPPYFALDDIAEVAPGLISASVPHVAPTAPEFGAMEAAQVARHLAILGSCAAALSRPDDKQHHYLAVEAHYTRAAGAPTDLTAHTDGRLVASALSTWLDKRSARAITTLRTQDGIDLNFLEITYAAMTPRMFERLHQGDRTEHVPGGEVNAFAPAETQVTSNGVRCNVGPIPASACAGHFPGIPAAPVAVVMGQLCRTAASAMATKLDANVGYRIEEGHVTATKLARAGQSLSLEASYLERRGANHLVRGEALADGTSNGNVEVVLSAVDPVTGTC